MGETLERIYSPDQCISFRKTSEPFGGLSNMAPGFRVRVNGTLFLTVEALYQACRFPHIPDLQEFIIQQKSPMTLKMRIRHMREDSRPDWNRVRVKIMKWCLRVKLSQNLLSFGTLLLETGDKSIVEDSRKDPFWGAMMNPSGLYVGANVLGRLLMELRDEVRINGLGRPIEVIPPDVENFTLLGNLIGAVASSQTQHPIGRQDQIRWIPNFDAKLKISPAPITRELTRAFESLMAWISESGLDFEAKFELTSKGGCDQAALSRLETLLNELKVAHQVTTIARGTLRLDPHLRRDLPENGNTVISGSSNKDFVNRTSSNSKERS